METRSMETGRPGDMDPWRQGGRDKGSNGDRDGDMKLETGSQGDRQLETGRQVGMQTDSWGDSQLWGQAGIKNSHGNNQAVLRQGNTQTIN